MSAGRKALHNILNKIVAPVGGGAEGGTSSSSSSSSSSSDKESKQGLMVPFDEDLED